MPLDAAIELRFDRYLLPKSAVRQSILLSTGNVPFDCHQAPCLQPVYDVVERVVSFRLAEGALLAPGLLYHVELTSPLDGDDTRGFRAFDGAPLSTTNAVPLKWSFFTARATPTPPLPPAAPTCNDALGALSRSGCSSAGCHSGGDAPMGLRLDSGEALRETAIAHVAHEADTGPISGQPLVDPARFGTGMPVIDPGAPGTSYLMYKLLVGPANFGACETKYEVGLPSGICPAPSPAERTRLLDWFVRLEPMPLGGTLVGTRETLDLLQGFILAGSQAGTCP